MKTNEIFCEMPALKITDMALEGKGTNFVAVLQALQFALNNKKQFEEEITECDVCWELIEYSQQEISGMITTAIEHGIKHSN